MHPEAGVTGPRADPSSPVWTNVGKASTEETKKLSKDPLASSTRDPGYYLNLGHDASRSLEGQHESTAVGPVLPVTDQVHF